MSNKESLCVQTDNKDTDLIKIGKGSYGQVYKQNLNSVIKECDKFDKTGSCGFHAFELSTITEISVLSIDGLKHTPKLKNFQSTKDNKILISMEDGGQTLLQFAKNLKLDERLAYLPKFAFQLIEACLYLQENGIIHNDVKSSNVLVNSNNDINLIDFGLCAFETISKPNSNFMSVGTSMSKAFGTYTICPPESFLYNNWSVYKYMPWSIGVTLCEFLFRTHSVICEHVLSNEEKTVYKNNYKNDWTIKQILRVVFIKRAKRGDKTLIDFLEFRNFPTELAELMHNMLSINEKNRLTLMELYRLPIFAKFRLEDDDNNRYLGIIPTLHCNIVPRALFTCEHIDTYKIIRTQIINHIFDIYAHFNKLNLFTQAIHIFDKYCAVKHIDPKSLYTIGAASAYIAQYIEKSLPIPLTKFAANLSWMSMVFVQLTDVTKAVEDVIFSCSPDIYSQTFDVQIAKTGETINVLMVLEVLKETYPPYNNNMLVKKYVSKICGM